MARVVQRRSNPPYLLIAMCFLFVGSLIVAIKFYMNWDEEIKKHATDMAKYAKVETPEQAKKEVVPRNGQTVVENARSDVSRLVKIITGLEGVPVDEADSRSTAAKTAFDPSTSGEGFIKLLAQAKDAMDKKEAELKQVRASADKARQEADNSTAAQTAQQKAFETGMADLANQNKAQVEANAKQQKDYEASLQAAKDEHQKAMDDMNKQLGDKDKKLNDLEQKLRIADMKVRTIEKQFRDEHQPHLDLDKPTHLAKGRVAEVVDDIAYIDRGTKDKITVGMTFSVYSPGSMALPDAKPKASLVVTSVNPNTSECKVRDARISNPVLSGDLLQNIAYEPNRVYAFVVMGDFDLHLTGKATRQGGRRSRT